MQPNASADAVTDALTLALQDVRMQSVIHCPTQFSASWGLRVSNKGGAPYGIVMDGRAWLEVEGRTAPIALESGDFYVLPHDTPFIVRDAPDSHALPIQTVLERYRRGDDGILRYGGGGATTTAVAGCFYFEDGDTSPLLRALPDLLLVRGARDNTDAWIKPVLSLIACEAGGGRPGAQSVTTRLSEVLFIGAIRAWLANADAHDDAGGTAETCGGNWLRALRDAEIGQALALIHQNPAHGWQVGSLAAAVAMSRSSFAARFAAFVGETPLQYVTRWRVHKAARLLRQSRDSIAFVAAEVGYQSEAAFSKTFRDATGLTPGAYRRLRQTVMQAENQAAVQAEMQAETPPLVLTDAANGTGREPGTITAAQNQKPTRKQTGAFRVGSAREKERAA